ncbi:MAG: Aspartate racemase [Parcubacteria group bacterium GW2011_GWB1_43_6]|nr:MAG: Aspartate racemase [Parcubacteria group bacterium GW2011_GWB1_43_6]
MKTLGIIGGLGPQTTAKVYLSVINLIRKNGEDKYPPIVIYNLPFPFIIEKEAIIEGRNAEKMLPYLIDGAKILEKSGADFGILPCNTLHKYIKEIRESVNIPFLSILDETVLELKTKKIQTVGLLATKTTIESRIYEKVLVEKGIRIICPTEEGQNQIYDIIVQLLNGEENDLQSKKIEIVCNSLHEKGAESILLACTDLQLAISSVKSPIPIVDTTEVLINASVRTLIGKPN